MAVRDQKPTARFGGKRAGAAKILRKEITVDEAAPTTKNAGLKLTEHFQCQWAVMMPAGVTSFSASYYTRVVVEDDAAEEIVSEWFLVETETGLTEPHLYYQFVDTQRIAIRIHDIVGVVGDGFTVIYTGIGRQ